MKELHELLLAIQQAFDELLAVEAQKLEAITTNNVAVMDECIKKEEALALKLRGLDKKREDVQRECGYEGLTLLQTAEKEGGAMGELLRQDHGAMSAKAKALGEALEGTRKLIELNIETIDGILAQRFAEENGYQPTGEKAEEPDKPRFTPKEV